MNPSPTETYQPLRHRRGLLALSPMLFLVLYMVASVAVGDFYLIPLSVTFLAASVYAVAITRGLSVPERVNTFSRGAGDSNIMLMIWIFILAGAFSVSSKAMGAVDATVNLSLWTLPEGLIPAGLFVGACFISLSIGTSVGTIVAMAPVAVGIARATGQDPAFVTAIIVGGAFFGDNLSFISDTTIAATRTQGCAMADKFKANLHIVLPAALVMLAYYLYYGMHTTSMVLDITDFEPVKIIPYAVVLVCAICGVNVSLVLVLGILSTGIIGILTCGFDGVTGWIASLGEGVAAMGDLIVITLLAGGLLEMIRVNGGIEYILTGLTRHIRGRRGAEFSIAALVSLANLCTANNTVAIITVGSISADISRRYGVDPRKSASLLDTFSCVVQGLIPYGAQLLMAAGIAVVSPLQIIRYLYYPMALCVCALAAIVIRRRAFVR